MRVCVKETDKTKERGKREIAQHRRDLLSLNVLDVTRHPELMDLNKQGFGLILDSVWSLFQHSHSPHHSVPQRRDLIHL